MKRIFKKILIYLIIVFFVLFCYFFVGSSKPAKEFSFGVVFSQKHAETMGLNWQETYSALLEDLGVKKIKLATYWDLIEPEENVYDFDDLDWQMEKALNYEADVVLVLGMKTPRWPECHIPDWAKGLEKEEQQERIIDLVKETVLRYRENTSIVMWQVENEPFFPFGECPWVDKDFLKEEINLVRSLDFKERPVIISDSGEGSFWFSAARMGDVVGTTMYKKVWLHQLGIYFTYPFPPVFYQRKAYIIEKLFQKEVICVELQAEPWGPELLYTSPLEEQEKSMDLEKFLYNIEFAKNTGFKEFYLWGAEWWYWMKEVQNNPEIWNEARKFF
ncbi:MAG: beta-galactosidase [Candidatus Nealsonbacteria bacterium]